MSPKLILSQMYDTIKIVSDDTKVVRDNISELIRAIEIDDDTAIETTSSSVILWFTYDSDCKVIINLLIDRGIKCEYEYRQLGDNNYARLYPEG